METKIFSGEVNGISLNFIDLVNSGTPSCVFTELQRDDYGLEQINLSPEDTVIDIGANIGMFSIYIKKKFGCKVIAFEPVSVNFEHFKKNIELNGLSINDFELHNVAITSKENDIIQIGTPPYNSGGSSIFHKCDIISNCKTERLHKYITKDCKYLKIDTEGGEFEIIPDILDVLNNFKYIGIEYHTFMNNHNPLELHNLIVSNFKGQIFGQIPN
jgi:FkbM family methyltransferase